MWCVKAVISNINTTAHKGVLKLGACFVYKVLSSGKILFQTMLKHLILLTNDTVTDTQSHFLILILWFINQTQITLQLLFLSPNCEIFLFRSFIVTCGLFAKTNNLRSENMTWGWNVFHVWLLIFIMTRETCEYSKHMHCLLYILFKTIFCVSSRVIYGLVV